MMRRYLLTAALVFLLGLIAYNQQSGNANSQGNIQNYSPLVYSAEPTPTPTNTPLPTVTPTATQAPYPATPWSLQQGEIVYEYNCCSYWIQGYTYLLDGETPAIGDQFQVCSREGKGCSGPSAPSRENGFFDWVGFNGGDGETDGDGRYYAVLVDCTGVEGNPQDETIGNWPACPERSERVNFSLNSGEARMIANVNWYRVAVRPGE
jgi:hypothetical protein